MDRVIGLSRLVGALEVMKASHNHEKCVRLSELQTRCNDYLSEIAELRAEATRHYPSLSSLPLNAAELPRPERIPARVARI